MASEEFVKEKIREIDRSTDGIVNKDGKKLSDIITELIENISSKVGMQEVNARINELVDGAPEAFDTLKEIADYLAQHEEVAIALNEAIGNKVDKETGKSLISDIEINRLKGVDNYDDTEVRQKITAIETEQTTQNETIKENTNKITANVEEITKLKEENAILKFQFPAGEAEGESITLRDSAEGLEIEGLRIGGNSFQEAGEITDDEENVIESRPSIENPSEIEAVKENVEVVTCNKNLLDTSGWQNCVVVKGSIEKVKGGYKLTSTNADCYTSTYAGETIVSNNRYYIKKYGFVAKANTQYTFSFDVDDESVASNCFVFFADEKFNYLGNKSTGGKSLTFTTPANCRYITARIGITNAETSLTFTNIQITEEEKVTEYVEHQSQNCTIPVQQEMLKGDYLDLEREEEVHVWRKWVLDGVNHKTTYKHTSIGSDTRGFYAIIVNNKLEEYKSGSPGGVLCTHLMTYDDSVYSDVVGQDCIYWQKTGDYLYLSVPFLSVAEVNNWLKEQYEAGTPVTIYYRLKEAIRIPFTEEQKQKAEEMRHMRTYKEVTHVESVAEGVKPILRFGYRKDLQIENDKIKTRLDEIEALLSTTSTSALLLDNLENDLKGEVM